jgi:hypothetical protein
MDDGSMKLCTYCIKSKSKAQQTLERDSVTRIGRMGRSRILRPTQTLGLNYLICKDERIR